MFALTLLGSKVSKLNKDKNKIYDFIRFERKYFNLLINFFKGNFFEKLGAFYLLIEINFYISNKVSM